MTQSIQTSFFTRSRLESTHQYPGLLYTVIVNTEEGESFEYEIEADTFADATRIAEGFANDLMTDITYIEVYNQEYL